MAHRDYEQAKYFVLAFCTAFIAFSLPALGMALLPRASMEQTQPVRIEQEDIPVDAVYLPREQDAITVLLVARQNKEYRFFIAGLDVQRGELPVAYLPPELLVQDGGKSHSLEELYRMSGPLAVKEALTKKMGVPIQRWLALDEAALAEITPRLGPVEYTAPGTEPILDSGMPGAVKQRELKPPRIRADTAELWSLLFTAKPNPALVTAIVRAYLDAALQTALATDADDFFRTVVNAAETDISFSDYDSRREALRFLAGLGRTTTG